MWYNLKWVLCMEEKIKETINIIKPYLKTEDDNTVDLREGGFGSTDAASQPVLQEA